MVDIPSLNEIRIRIPEDPVPQQQFSVVQDPDNFALLDVGRLTFDRKSAAKRLFCLVAAVSALYMWRQCSLYTDIQS